MIRVRNAVMLAFLGCLFMAGFGCAVRTGRLVGMRALPSTIQPLPTDPTREAAKILRIGCYNVAHARGGELGAENSAHANAEEVKAHLDKIAALLVAQDLDVVVLNEVDFDAHWSHGVDQALYLQQAAGFAHLAIQHNIDVTLPFRSWRFGNVILSRHPMTELMHVSLPAMRPWERVLAGNHDAVLATIAVPGFGPVDVLGVHLEVRSEATRVEAARTIVDIYNSRRNPFVVLGDFNSTPSTYPGSNPSPDGGTAIDEFLKTTPMRIAWSPREPAADFSFPSAKPDRAIDWVVVSEELSIRKKQVVPSNLSDHLMIVVELR